LLLQNNQKDLENATEQLSEYLERDITSDTLCDMKQKVQDKSRSGFSIAVSLPNLPCYNTHTIKLRIEALASIS